jgi:hypothetical protein
MSMSAGRIVGLLGWSSMLLLACTRAPAPAAPDASAPAPPPPAPAVDAGPDMRDAAADSADAADARGPGRKHAGKPASGGGGGGHAGLEVSGSLPKAEAAKVVHAKAGALRACYDEARAKNPGLRGRVSFRLTVDGRGRVTLGEVVSSTLEATGIEMCMGQATRTFKFPASPGGGESIVTFQMNYP